MTREVGTRAPDFELSSQFGEQVRLSDFVGKKPVALVFFPLAFTGTCTTELCTLRDNLALFAQHGVELLGISVDSRSTLRAFAEHEGYDFTMLSDFWPHGAVAREYGVFLEQKGYANRSTFVIDAEGVIRASFTTDPDSARPFAEYRAALAAVLPTPEPSTIT